MDLYTLGGIKISMIVIKAIQNSKLSPNIENMLVGGDGAARNTFTAIGSAQPEITFETVSIKIALGACGITGCAMTGALMYLNKLLSGGLRATGITHFLATVVGGYLFPVRVSVRKKAPATISYRGILLSADGSAAPVAISAAAALTGEGDATEVYTLGPVLLNGTSLDNVEGFDIDFGIAPEITTPNGLVYPTDCSIMKIDPKISIDTSDIDAAGALGIAGVAQGVTDSTLQLVDVTEGGARGTSPITFTIDEGRMHFEEIGALHGQKGASRIIITPTWDGTAEVIAITGI